MRRLALAALSFSLLVPLFADTPASTTRADDTSIGVIVFADGDEVTIVRGTKLVRLDVAHGDAFGEPVYAGDQVSTADGTTAEIQLLTSRNILKLAENTTIVVRGLATGGETRVDLSFGRVRAQVASLTGNQRFNIRGMSAVAGVRGTSFGYDQVLDAATGKIVDRVYCFDGVVHVESNSDESVATDVLAGQLVETTGTSVPADAAVVSIPVTVQRFWNDRPFAREAKSVQEIMSEFPDLAESVAGDLGALPAVLESVAVSGGDKAEFRAGVDASDVARADSADNAGKIASTDAAAPGATDVAPAEPGPAVTRIERPAQESSATPAAADTGSWRDGVHSALLVTGVTLTAGGLLTDVVAVALYFFGDQIPGWTDGATQLMKPITIGGLIAVAAGLLSLVGSAAFAP